ncbi:MAG: hypothetical protein H0V01_02950 [Bacteroidetes bacterium]|nr:hypothetical protein [Bacteroidota bacterium]HET6245890.1 hypothetical protein [Bacteroidia bacterium]
MSKTFNFYCDERREISFLRDFLRLGFIQLLPEYHPYGIADDCYYSGITGINTNG